MTSASYDFQKKRINKFFSLADVMNVHIIYYSKHTQRERERIPTIGI
jgi:hypothetical protein